MLSRSFRLPAIMPSRKILSVDIGGTLAKTAFYVPRDDPIRLDPGRFEALTHETIPSKLSALILKLDISMLKANPMHFQ